ncbi:MAG: ComF family protein [Cyanobacteria bacterium J06597_16]
MKSNALKTQTQEAQKRVLGLVQALSSVFLGQACPVCDRDTRQTFCTDCYRQLPIVEPSTLQPTTSRQAIEQCASVQSSVQSWYTDPTHSLPISALGDYGGLLKRAILAMKYSNRPDVAKPLGYALGQLWLSQRIATEGPLYAVPIPLHAERQTTRGYNQAEVIAHSFCKVTRLPMLASGLVRTQATQPQHQLNLAERTKNLDQVFQIGPALSRIIQRADKQNSLSALLIDDIYTTGTTVRSAAKVLEQAGIDVVGTLTLARAIL